MVERTVFAAWRESRRVCRTTTATNERLPPLKMSCRGPVVVTLDPRDGSIPPPQAREPQACLIPSCAVATQELGSSARLGSRPFGYPRADARDHAEAFAARANG